MVAFLRAGVDVMGEFVARWTALVPRLRDLKAAAAEARKAGERRARKEAEAVQRRAAKAGGGGGSGGGGGEGDAPAGMAGEEEEDGDGDGGDEEEEHVEQEGCPDDTDFNRWVCGVRCVLCG